jgi:lactoylglutathione lyase
MGCRLNGYFCSQSSTPMSTSRISLLRNGISASIASNCAGEAEPVIENERDSGGRTTREHEEAVMEVKMVILSTDDLDESIRFYSETLGMPLKFRDGAHFAALDGGPITLALATSVDHPIPGQVVVGIKTDDVDAAAKAVEASGGGIVNGPYDDAHERRAVVYDNKGNGVVFYKPLAR